MALIDRVHVARRYQRAIRIDTDVGERSALEGFVCPKSSANVLETMAHHVFESGQGAFTWTGPYGGGKSSLAVALCAALGGDKACRREVASIFGPSTSAILEKELPPRSRGWRILPVIGRREPPLQVIGEAIKEAGLLTGNGPRVWTEKRVIDFLTRIAASNPRSVGGLIVFIDEMGKFLEAAAHDKSDIHLFQQLAELSSRSNGRLIIVGILHQAFEEYAHGLSREVRDEWAKIQGRFVDLAVNTVGVEQIDLLGRAIDSGHSSKPRGQLARKVAGLVQGQVSPHLATMLDDCWPLHPITACLLGPASRRRFGQNQRSIFGFLNSVEPQGFQDFLSGASEDDLYDPDRLWDYLRINLESSILASPDGHRWALAVDALDRCEALGGKKPDIKLLKVIAIVSLFKNRSGLTASTDLLYHALPGVTREKLKDSLVALENWSTIVFRKFTNSYAIFEGSDFDIEATIQQAQESIGTVDLATVGAIANLQPIVAKRHYHETGMLRWFDVGIVSMADIKDTYVEYMPHHGAIGSFLFVIPTQGESEEDAEKICREIARAASERGLVIGLSKQAWSIPGLATELSALEWVRDEASELQGDRVARAEVTARIVALEGQLESELERALDSATWYAKHRKAKVLSRAELNIWASELADMWFQDAPHIHNELLCRTKPSSSAVAARNALLRCMVLNEGKERIGIKGFPAEGGLFASLLEVTGLYRKTGGVWRFMPPRREEKDPHKLQPVWHAALDLLKSNSHRAVPMAELYDVWRQAPFGIKDGLLPVLAVAFFLSERRKLAFYRDKIFQARISDLDVDYLTGDPTDIQLRWMDLSIRSQKILSEIGDVVRGLNKKDELEGNKPIDVAKGLVAIHDRLPLWVSRTQCLSENARRIRQMFKQANDPNRLIFDDLPEVLDDDRGDGTKGMAKRIAGRVREGLDELLGAYPAMLNRMREMLLTELQASTPADLRTRAENIRGLGGDFLQEAFIMRLAQFEGHDTDIESLAGMAVHKSLRDWVDADVDRAMVALATMARSFIHAEAFAHVKGRTDKRHAMAVVVGIGGNSSPIYDEFEIAETDRQEVTSLVEQMEAVLHERGQSQRSIILAALAELSARHIGGDNTVTPVVDELQKQVTS